MTIIELDSVTARYGTVPALFSVSLRVQPGEAVALLGANGAGKTTTLRAISRMVRTTGSIRLAGRDIAGYSPDRVARAGVAHVPAGRGTLVELTVRENLVLGAYGRPRSVVRKRLAGVLEALPRLAQRQRQHAGTLSGGEQQMLAIGRALMSEPRVLLLDEPSMGLSPRTTEEVYDLIRQVASHRELSIVLAEQDVEYALDIADRVYLLQAGYSSEMGTAAQVREQHFDASYLS